MRRVSSRRAIFGHRQRTCIKTTYPWSPNIAFTVEPERESSFTLALRIPSWSKTYSCRVNGELYDGTLSPSGYLLVSRSWKMDDSMELTLDMQAHFVFADPLVREDAGKVALQRGPLVFCLEEIDNGSNLHAISVSPDTRISESYDPDALGGIVTLSLEARRDNTTYRPEEPYGTVAPESRPVTVIAVPYFAWCNRRPGEMIVWVRSRRSIRRMIRTLSPDHRRGKTRHARMDIGMPRRASRPKYATMIRYFVSRITFHDKGSSVAVS